MLSIYQEGVAPHCGCAGEMLRGTLACTFSCITELSQRSFCAGPSQILREGEGWVAEPLVTSSVESQMANDSTETSEAGEEEEDHEGDSENKERMPFIQ